MPTNFYARYVPPAPPTGLAGGVHGDDDNDSKDINPNPKKKRKTVDADNDLINSTETGSSINADVLKIKKSKESKKPQKPKKSKKEAPEPAPESLSENPEDTIEDKHRSIRTKYKKANEITQELLQAEEPQSTIDDEDILERIQPVGLEPLPQPKRTRDVPKSSLSVLPEWLSKPVLANKTASFQDLGLPTKTMQRLSQAGFENAFAIQSAILPMLLTGPNQHRGDICVSAATGSGKTLAYTLPIIEALKDKPVVRLRALIVVPTRELVAQVQEVFRITGSALKVGTAVGSKSLKDEQHNLIEVEEIYDPVAYRKIYDNDKTEDLDWHSKALFVEDEEDMEGLPMQDHVFERSSKVDVLICTPGRLVDHLRNTKGFTLQHLQWLVVDEADRLLDQSFQQWLEVVMPKLDTQPADDVSPFSRFARMNPRSQWPLRKIILSATMTTITRDHSKLLALNLQNPVFVTIEGSDHDQQDEAAASIGPQSDSALSSIPERLTEVALAVKDSTEKPLYLVQLIEESIKQKEPNNNISAKQPLLEIDEDSDTSDSSSDYSTSDSSGDDSSSDDSLSSGNDSKFIEKSSIDEHSSIEGPPNGISRNHGVLIFTNTIEGALRLCRLLVILRPSWSSRVLPLTKSVGSSGGRKTLAAFRKGQADVLVATDLASRGLDLKDLAYVINYDMPRSLITYIHRVGRTARAEHKGTATTLVAHHEARWFWKEIGGSKSSVERRQKVRRAEIVVPEGLKAIYEKALNVLGKEAKASG